MKPDQIICSVFYYYFTRRKKFTLSTIGNGRLYVRSRLSMMQTIDTRRDVLILRSLVVSRVDGLHSELAIERATDPESQVR